ncbi:ATP synthase F1 subcomplex delta subunit [Thermosyntropha lipolytica DSM 11003]|uniref:ATP synthase subunit delta n=1 Tax=Thermosyntropha lipolytica DSM 11003 TaxID=1123382 RepID=A0A1M5NUB9_9FIRM|nr:F0F1 ATP synthase subunit delta [Thermosyntropha lipolytica]SHG93035.1 ATP synthase F1 subcomplex delta subunit [Thermosyntropha lipolytica DSM 11003]
MLNKSVARRYAEAFFSIAQEKGNIDQYQQELEYVIEAINGVEYLKEYLWHLLIPTKDKKETIRKILDGKVSETTLNFVCLIIDKRRERYLELIVEEYKNMADDFRNIIKAELVSAKEIPEEQVQALAERLSQTTGKIVKFTQKVDPSLLGGVKIRVGDQVIDGTVAKKLETLREALKQAKIS